MSDREWQPVTRAKPCPACGKPDWCAWTLDGWLKCERSTEASPGMIRVSVKDGGAVFRPDNPHAPPRKAGTARQRSTPARKTNKVYPTVVDAVAALKRTRGTEAARWTYRDAAGAPCFVVVRFPAPPDPEKPGAKPDKTFRPVSRVVGGWTIGDPPEKLTLYRLPELLAAPAGSRVYVGEGEKTADVTASLGLVVTTSAHGSSAADKSDWSPVAGHDVVILPDHDAAGEKYAADVARLAMAAGAKSVRIVRLVDLWAGMPEGGDMADLVNHRGADAESIRAEVDALADKGEPVSVKVTPPAFPSYTPFPVEALPASMRRHIQVTAKGMDADPVLIATPALSIFAGAIGNAARVIVKRGWTESSCLWTGVVALPGSLKSQTQSAAAAPMHVAQRSADSNHSSAMTEYQTAKTAHEAAKKPRNKRAKEATIAPEPEEPKRWQCLTQDATPESLVGVLNNNPRGVVNLWDELGGFFGGFARYSKGGANGGEPGAAFYKSAYTGTTHTENRKGPDGKGRYVRVECPLVSVAGGIQPEALKRILLRQYLDDGLASRFLWAWPPDQPGGWVDDDGDDAAAAHYAETYRRLLGIPLGVDPSTGELNPAFVGLLREAQSIAREWVQGVQDRVRNAADPAIRAAWAKLKGGAFRIALVLHLTEWAERGEGDFGAIGADTMRRAVLIAEWFGREAERVYGMLSESDGDGEARRLVEWIERKGGTVTARDLTHGLRAYRGDPDGAERALSALVDASIGRWEADTHGPKGGRPAQKFRLASTGTVTETPANAGKEVGFGDGDIGGVELNIG